MVNNLLYKKTGFGTYDLVPPGAKFAETAGLVDRAYNLSVNMTRIDIWLNEARMSTSGLGGPLKLNLNELWRAYMQ